MNLQEVLNSFINTILENLPEIIGITFATLIVVFIGWMLSKLRGRPKDPLKRELTLTPTSPRDGLSTQYLSDVIRRGSTLSFGDPASWTVAGGDGEGMVTLDEIWTPLRVADSQTRKGKTGTHESMAEAHQGTDLRSLFDSTDEPLLILGDPGSGKSTSLGMFAVDAARSWSEDGGNPLPIWVSLATVTATENATPEQLLLSSVPEIGVTVTRLGFEGGDRLTKFLHNAIIQGNALLLLDGLDEVKEHLLPQVRVAISRMVGLRNGTRVIVTCRTFDYRQSTPRRKIPIERELELLPYSPEEQRLYAKRWYDASVRIGRFAASQAEDLASALVYELRNEAIAELAESPLLLALLTLIHSYEAKLPDTRAVVCDRAIKYMLAESAKWRVREAGSSTLATPSVISLAIELAYRGHLQEEERGDSVGITADLINELASEICEVMARADPTKKVPLPSDMAQRFLRSHGLLLDSGNGRFRFAHRSFQEFLVGRYYAAGAHHAEALSRASSTHWREPFKLMASFAGHEGENLFYILTLIEDLLSAEVSAVSSAQLGAEMLTEIGRPRVALRQFNKVLEEGGLWARAQSMLSEHVENPSLTLSERERSASALGFLGDPRFVSGGNPLDPWTHLIDVPAGAFDIGSTRPDEHSVTASGGFVASPRRVEFVPLRIARYPVTNAEFRAFVESDGYTNPAYWKGELAPGWVSGNPEVLEFIREHWLSTLYEHHAKEIRDGEIDPERAEEESIIRTAPRTAPFYWLDRRFNRPNQPVVGINWWEANAFCEWATQMGHKTGRLDPANIISLPTEFEWEHASRPTDDDRIYPWGDQWSDKKAHVSTNILNMRHPAPVGICLEPWPAGPCDLAGNVWEWTASLHLPYSAEYDSQRFSVDSIDERVVRGSSWLNTSFVAACSVRCVDRSYNLFYDVGFRVVCLHRDLEAARL